MAEQKRILQTDSLLVIVMAADGCVHVADVKRLDVAVVNFVIRLVTIFANCRQLNISHGRFDDTVLGVKIKPALCM